MDSRISSAKPIVKKRTRYAPRPPASPPTKDSDRPSTSKRVTQAPEVTNDIKEKKSSGSFIETLKETCFAWVEASPIHGFQYLRGERHHKEKMFWIVLLIIAMIVCVWLILKEYWRWNETPVILSFAEREHEVSQIPFPAVTICTECKYSATETLNFTRFYKYIYEKHGKKSEFVEKPPWLSDDEFLKMRALLQVCGNFLVKGLNFETYPKFDIENQLNSIVPKFNDDFLHCQFNDTSGECATLFEKFYTEEGICYVFNGFNSTELYREDTQQYQHFLKDVHIRNRKKHVRWNIIDGFYDKEDYNTYPERVLGSGFDSALLVILRGFEENFDYICRGPVQGFKVILHAPDVIPQVEKSFFLVPYEEDILFLVTPALTFTTDGLRDISPEKRKCYYPDEKYLRFFKSYNRNNCEIECIANFTLRECGCVHFAMPRLTDTEVCDAKNIECFDRAENDFLRSEYTDMGNPEYKCNCLPDCWTLDYHVRVSDGAFNMRSILKGTVREDAKATRVTIYFEENEFRPWQRSEFITLTDFIGQCGGLFGVLMGGTLLIILELVYYIFVYLCLPYAMPD